MNYYIGIDIGTSSTKSVLFDNVGNVITSSSYEYDIIVLKNGYAEQNPRDWLNAVIKSINDIASSVDPKDIKGIGLSGQMHGLVMLDKDDNVLDNAIIWCDNRTDKEVLEISKFGSEKIREITGNYPMPAFTLAKLLWIKNNKKDIYNKISKIMLPKDYIRYMLTNEFKTEYSDASGMQMMDLKNECFSKEILDYFDINPNILPKIISSDEISGYMKDGITLLNSDTFVVGGAGDQAAGAIGNGIIKEGDLSIALGSSGVVFAPVNKLEMKNSNIQYFHHAIKNTFHMMGVTNGCGNSLKWYKENICSGLAKEALENNENVYDYLTKNMDQVPAGSNGLIFLPYLLGERTPHLNTIATGSFIGIRSNTTIDYMTRSVIEGISYSMKDCYELIDFPINKVLVNGGGAKNPKWCRILASMINKDISRINSSEGPALGVAILAMKANNEYGTIEEACMKIITIKDTFTPNKDDVDIYNKYFEVYKMCYLQNKIIYEMTERIK
ncbi:MAG: xylulokinase [Anaeroplasmataceae bacterium]